MPTKLTDHYVKNAEPGTTWDALTTGLGLRVTTTGRKIWLCQLTWPGQSSQSRRTMGLYPGMSLADARRTAAAEWYQLCKVGTDPRQVEAERRVIAAREANTTFGKVAEDYIGRRTNRRADKDGKEIRRLLVSAWENEPIASITPRMVRQLIGNIAKRTPHGANAAWGHADLIFKFAVHLELMDASPYASLDKKLVLNGAKLVPRQRVLSDDEIFAFWRATRRLDYPERQLYQLLLMTGCRWSEVNGASWSEFRPELRKVLRDHKASGQRIDWSAVPDAHKLWTVPADRFKSDQLHTVPLTNTMCELQSALPMTGPFLFSFDDGDAPMWAQSRTKATIDAHMVNILKAIARKRGDVDDVTLPHWVNHDLRRVVRTNLSALGVDDHIAELVLGHGRKGLQRVYDRHRYLPEIRSALTKWNNRLVELVGDA